MEKNEGIVINGGELNFEQLAVGRSASININNTMGTNDIVTKIDALLNALEVEKNNIDNYKDVKGSGEIIKKELSKEKPDKSIVYVLLNMIANSVPAISAITTAIKSVKEIVELSIK
ncbi:MAG: hypothetical protein GY737_29365 [Desulfobacteraceae bacterium]|nr:hypothetical protein [Desulfobacteraceae bacterium]